MRKINKKGQEEMVGFGIIMILVAIILLVFLSFSLRNNNNSGSESYQVDNFIQSFLQYHTDCSDNTEYLAIQDLIFACTSNDLCLDGRETCEVLNSTLFDLIEVSWNIGEDTPNRGYKLIIRNNFGEGLADDLVDFEKGNLTGSFLGSSQNFVKRTANIDIYFDVYN